MKKACLLLTTLVFISACTKDSESGNSIAEDTESTSTFARSIEALSIENLFRDSLALAGNVEAVVSYLEVPANSALPPHYHPGEEFVYLIEGSGQVTIEDSTWTVNQGEFQRIPFKAPHSFATQDQPAIIVVFRAHEKGQPDRILIE